MTDPAEQVAANVAEIRQRISAAARRSRRPPEEVRLVAVTKYAGQQATRWLWEAGCHDLGESRPQQLVAKMQTLADLPVRWHLIGHLQRNKARKVVGSAHLIHSIDSLRLLDAIESLARQLQAAPQVLLEVNISEDEAKHGFRAAEMPELLQALSGRLQRTHVAGLMGMAGLTSDHAQAAREFQQLRELRDSLRSHCPAGVDLDELSMGMSRDFEAAVEQGATLVRVGSALLEGVPLADDPAPAAAATQAAPARPAAAIDLQTTDAGVLLPVRVQAGARMSAVRGEQQGALKVAVQQAPEKGKANRALLALLAKSLGLSKSQLTIVAGETSNQKKLLVTGAAADDLLARISALLSEAAGG